MAVKANIPEELAMMVRLSDDGYANNYIGKKYGMAPETAKTRISHFRKTMRIYLGLYKHSNLESKEE